MNSQQGQIYGRLNEISLLSQAYYSTCLGSAEIVYVSGAPGIGKTSLLDWVFRQEHHHPRTSIFLTGKFEQIAKDSPYHPIIQEFRGFMRHLLGESSQQVDAWAKKLRSALRSYEAVIAAMIPEVRLLIGDIPDAWELPPDEAKKRFIYAFRKFVQTLASKERPLVLFIDDLQWADASSLQLLHALLCDPELQYVLFVGAYRDGEMNSTKLPGYEVDGNIAKEAVVHHIQLRELSVEEMNSIVMEALGCGAAEATPLTLVMYPESQGNPFHFKQILGRLLDDRLLTYDHERQGWEWNLSDLIEQEQHWAIGELMAHKLLRLTRSAKEVLDIAACLGGQFEQGWIADVTQLSADDTSAELEVLVEESLIVRFGQDQYRFVHDSVQNLIYNQMENETRRRTHLAIGRRLLETGSSQPEGLFEVVKHLNNGSSDIHDVEELHRLVELNLAAGQRAKASTAYDIALQYYRKGVELLAESAWELHYATCFELHVERAECEYLCGHHEITEHLIEHLLRRARSSIERSKVQMLRMIQCINQKEYQEATLLGLESLKEFRINVSPNPLQATVVTEVLRVHMRLRGRIEQLVDLPEMSEPSRIAAANILFLTLVSSFRTDKKVYFLLACKAVRLSLKHGNTPAAADVYTVYGLVLALVLGRRVSGYEIAKVGLKLAERYDIASIKSKTYATFGSIICQLAGKMHEGEPYLEQAVRFAKESGDDVYLNTAIGARIHALYTRGPLGILSKALTEYTETLAETKDDFVLQNLYLCRQFVLALQGETESACSLDTAVFEERTFLEQSSGEETASATLFQYYAYKTQLCYLDGKYEEAVHWQKEAEPLKLYAAHLTHLPECLYYGALAELVIYGKGGGKGLPSSVGSLRHAHRQLSRLRKWAKVSPDIFQAKQVLVEAELARVSGRYAAAEAGYDRAIREAHEHDNVQVESVANELAGSYYARQGKAKVALHYLQAARDAYARWGASLKVRQIRERLAAMGDEEALSGNWTPTTSEAATAAATEEQLPGLNREAGARDTVDAVDLAAILRASQALTNKMELDAVLPEIISTLMNYAGARKGVLLMVSRGQWFVQAWADVKVRVLYEPALLEDDGLLPGGIVRYVARTQEVVRYSVDEESWLRHNPYIAEHRPQSVLCMPVAVQGSAVGVLYLENYAATSFVSEDRIHILHAMASQCVYICELLRSLGRFDGESVISEEPDVEKGGDMTLDTAPAPTCEPLTDREMEVLALLAAGLSNKEIAEQLVVAVGTVKVHVKNIFTKLKVNRRTKAIAQAKELHLLD
ncbi:GAF domain-containing protein [Cohnella endophytica]|uniref:GAF domain-containing protein n=1 Tax=Cohnella endophytica TaxID=2419778 RepID=A0A494X792_9BACL|nr:AAA family ATPase [Cohnella endophytica]RKP46310.1 GAF domain-containing protein [Cohnella endophytica]